MSKKAFTMMELVIALALIAILALITVPLAKSKIGKIDRYSYYLAYSAVQDIAANVVAQSEYEFNADDLASASDLFGERLAMYYPSYKYMSASATTFQTCNGVGSNGGCSSGYSCVMGHCVNANGQNQAGNAVFVQGPNGGGGAFQGGTVAEAEDDSGCYISNCKTYAVSGCICMQCNSGYHVSGRNCVQDTEPSSCNKTCSGNYTLNSSTCSCECNTGSLQSWAAHAGNATVNTSSCTVECKSGYTMTSGSCVKNAEPSYSEPATNSGDYCPSGQYKGESNVCKSCTDLGTWAEYKNHMPPCPQACERFGMIYSSSKNTCVMPVSAKHFCERIKAEYNTRSSSCDITAAQMRNNVQNGFKDVTPSIKLSNGLNIYLASDLIKIDNLSDAVDKRDRIGYLVYVDSNGNKGKGILYQDVFPFYILMTGKVVPLYNPTGVGGANNVENLAGNILYDDYSTGNRVVKASQTNVDFQTGACATRYIQSANYCKGIAVDANCTATSDCRYVINKPMKFFGR